MPHLAGSWGSERVYNFLNRSSSDTLSPQDHRRAAWHSPNQRGPPEQPEP